MHYITLAYDEKASGFITAGESEKFTMTIQSVEFAEIRHPGIVIELK